MSRQVAGTAVADNGDQAAPRRVTTTIVVLALACAFGAVDQYLGTFRSSFLTSVSGMSAPWLLMPFLAGLSQPGPRRAAWTGLAASWLAVLAYVAMVISPMEGTHLGPRPAGVIGSWNQLSPHLVLATLGSQWLWFAGGLATGPLYGWLGYRWRTRRSVATALIAALPLVLEPAARWLAGSAGPAYASGLSFQPAGTGPAVAEIAAGLLLTGAVLARARRHQPASA
jgi:hypothetical protein